MNNIKHILDIRCIVLNANKTVCTYESMQGI